jgi:hypothetical protein
MVQSRGEIDFITCFVSTVKMLNAPRCLLKVLANSSDTHAYPTRHATRGLFTVPKFRTDYGRTTVLHRAITIWNSIQHQVADASSIIRFKEQINTPYGTAGTMKRHTHIGTDTNIHMLTHALYTHVHMDFVL